MDFCDFWLNPFWILEPHCIFFRVLTRYGLQPLSLLTHVVTMKPDSSDVTLQPVPTNGYIAVPEQSLVIQNGQFWNLNLAKILSINNKIVRADPNDTRGAVSWTIGNQFILFLSLVSCMKAPLKRNTLAT